MSIEGDKPGETDYVAARDDQDVITLTAPDTVTVEDVRYDFVWGLRDDVNQPQGQTDLQITMGADRAATGIYRIWTHTLTVQSIPSSVNIAGNGDCTANILDLLFVRNRLQTGCSDPSP